jgi:predicted Zn finger-like uncharacterized protein
MNRLTRCPACATIFRVADDQLQARQGFVRCGQCGKVFDGRASLADDPDPAAGEPPLDIELYLGPPSGPPAETPEPTPALSSPAPVQAPVPAPATAPKPAPVAAANIELPEVEAQVSAEPPEYSLAEAEPAPPAFEFGPKGRPRSRLATALWSVASIGLLLVLAAQAVYLYRSELAVAMPGAKPFLERACREIGCEVPPPRNAALLSIESSELQVDKNMPGLLTLNATLRNRATFPQAHPSLELTLTDAEDRPLTRRILGPVEYLGERYAREPVFPAASEHAIRLYIDATALKPTGYRLFLFHP